MVRFINQMGQVSTFDISTQKQWGQTLNREFVGGILNSSWGRPGEKELEGHIFTLVNSMCQNLEDSAFVKIKDLTP